jgi:hypothetical protein
MALRRGRTPDRSGWLDLPAAGREGEPPAWPFGRATTFEKAAWISEWTRPQAIAWERLGWTIQVALYVRTLSAASRPKATAGTTTNLLRQMENLGLTEGGMARNRWRVVDDAPAPQLARRPPGASAKDRLKSIPGGLDARAS